MSDNTGKFVWYEYMGDDLPGAVEFYRKVVGWDIAENNMAGFPYQIASVKGSGVAGMLKTPDDAKAMNAPSCWTGYVWVEDVDKGVAKLESAGGRKFKGPFDIPHVGRFAVVSDNQGAMFALFRDAGGNPPPEPAPGTPGLVGWRELHAADGAKAFAFYADQFGWKEASQFDMGPMGVYRLFDSGGQQGGIMTKMAQGPGPCWLYYFDVDGADAAADRVKEAGGKVLNGPHEVPGGQWVLQATDREGAMFGLVAPKK
jgi:predicted enzyme related to lactoylglutathione lyase